MIAIVGYGLAALAVLAVVVGLFDVAQAPRLRWTARDRRALWEQRRRDERVPVLPDANDD
jgi:hypothetical protein